MSESHLFDPELRRELLDRRDRDQDARHDYATAERGEHDWSPVDADNLDFLAPLLDRHGWLGSDLVDVDGAHRIGAAGVATVEIDPVVAAAAKAALEANGYPVTTVVGDAAAGYPANAPYDRSSPR